MVQFQDVFSVVAFFIFLRETLEASVIIAVLLQCMNRTAPRLKRQVWWGAATGIGLSILFGGIFAAVYYTMQAKLFQGNGKLIFQGCISYVACILISYLGFAMLRFANIEQKYMRKLDGAALKAVENTGTDQPNLRRQAWSVFILSSTAVLREGIESVVFLAGVGSNTSFKALPLACLAGLIVGLAVGFFIYYGGRSIKDLKLFFILSTVMLFFIAAGQVSLGTQLFSKVGVFGHYAAWADELSWQYKPVADLNKCCSDEFADGKQFFVLLHAVLGYQSRPSPIILIMYCFYWAVIIAVIVFKWHNGSLFDADYKRKRTLLKLTRKAAALRRQLTRCNRRINRLVNKVATDLGSAQQQDKIAAEEQKQQLLQVQLAAAEAERDAEADRLEAEDRAISEAAALKRGDGALQDLPDAEHGDTSSENSSSPAIVAIGSEAMQKDVELMDQQQIKGGWLSKLRRKQ